MRISLRAKKTKTRQRHDQDTTMTRQRHDQDTTMTRQRHDTDTTKTTTKPQNMIVVTHHLDLSDYTTHLYKKIIVTNTTLAAYRLNNARLFVISSLFAMLCFTRFLISAHFSLTPSVRPSVHFDLSSRSHRVD